MQSTNFFADGSPYLHHPLLTSERTTNEVDFLAAQVDLSAASRILDVGCGFGRHTIELARRGYSVVGIDPASVMIAAARERTTAVAVDVEYHCTPGEAYTDDRPFDAAICLFTTLGQMDDRGDNRALVKNMFARLRHGGHFVVEIPQRSVAVEALKRSERFGDDEAYTDVTRVYDAESCAITEQFDVVSADNHQEFTLRYRLFSANEIDDILGNAGFEIVARFADFHGNPLDAESPTMIRIGRKP